MWGLEQGEPGRRAAAADRGGGSLLAPVCALDLSLKLSLVLKQWGHRDPHLPRAFPPGSQGGRHQVVQQEHRQEQLHILLPALRKDVPEAEPADTACPDTHRCGAHWLLEDP